jgi:L-ascorbate metabolism protein UlaG (beta-lactamase superfamily)
MLFEKYYAHLEDELLDKKYQARPQATQALSLKDFEICDETAVYWLSAAGVLINSRGTTIMIDPILSVIENDPTRSEIGGMLLLAPPPIMADQVHKLDAILYTHSDGDHMGARTAKALLASGATYYTTPYAAKELRKIGIPENRIREYTRHSEFCIGSVRIRMTGAFHPHQIGNPVANNYWFFNSHDCTGFRLETQDGIIWNPGDTILMEEHFENTDADLVLMDFSDNVHHFGRELSIQLANSLYRSHLLAFHWGTVYSPDQDCYNADPEQVRSQIIDSHRLHVLAPGEKYVLKKNVGSKGTFNQV